MFYKVPDEDLLIFGKTAYRAHHLEQFVKDKGLGEDFGNQYCIPDYKEIIRNFDEQYELCE